MPAVTSGPLLKLPSPGALGKARPTHLPPFKAEQDGTGRGNKGRIRSCARRTGASLPGVNDSSHDTKRAVSSRDGPIFVSLMICRAGLRGRAPFSCGKKRALPLKLPLPPKTAHGKARSTRLPSFRAKNARRRSGNRNVTRRRAPYHTPAV